MGAWAGIDLDRAARGFLIGRASAEAIAFFASRPSQGDIRVLCATNASNSNEGRATQSASQPPAKEAGELVELGHAEEAAGGEVDEGASADAGADAD